MKDWFSKDALRRENNLRRNLSTSDVSNLTLLSLIALKLPSSFMTSKSFVASVGTSWQPMSLVSNVAGLALDRRPCSKEIIGETVGSGSSSSVLDCLKARVPSMFWRSSSGQA